jgi:hypothetical protein
LSVGRPLDVVFIGTNSESIAFGTLCWGGAVRLVISTGMT